ncbi:molecular chaperone HtpG [Pseudodesulfovibrio senegalensis]|uniref:Chaperone protein HtpG n=1 Tax=Pseudodesulfovibrio senegalensis TaxID=1721087 RepID=A0A6N6MZV0_9BACT|nr:molecular chaperone HtpG [Pseudodesulfovibrio senegalensis]KAB1440799.1 molecular chaperone HtpG [Pseudodesulfovibrio senegalensis]
MGRKTTHKFKAEISQLLDILVHSLYTNKEIFLRELVSNASDALEKYRFQSSTADNGADDSLPLEIRIETDEEAGTVTVTDTGVGMTREEVMANIGTIAHSGTAQIAKLAQEGKESLDTLIGRFGVGFYSVYMVADEVTVKTRSMQPDSPVIVWTSDGRTDYKLQELDEDLPRGTSITVQLKDDLKGQFTNTAHIKQVLTKHSNFVNFPIMVGDERVNTVPALWREPKFQIKPEQYAEFYKFLTFDSEDPFDTMHISVDAPVQFNALMFIPPKSTDFLTGMNRDNWGLDLYVRRVLIQHQNKDLLPEYLSFVRGVVDTEDLPLNISRETLQDNVLMRKISSTLTKQVLSHLEKMAADNADRYAEFWKEHGSIFKAGYMDFIHKDRYAKLVRFNSSEQEDADGLTSLADYVSRAREGQKEIYYAYGASREALALNPHLEMFRRKGIEVLYLYEPIDEFAMDTIREFEEFKLVAAEHADPAALDAFESKADEPDVPELNEEQSSTLDKLMARIKEVLGDSVSEVKVSARLSDSPVCLSNPDGHVTSSMDKIMRAVSKDTSIPVKVLEINPDHALVRNMIDIYAKNNDDPFVEQAARQLYESALLLEGYLTDPHALVGRIQSLLTQSSGWYVKAED